MVGNENKLVSRFWPRSNCQVIQSFDGRESRMILRIYSSSVYLEITKIVIEYRKITRHSRLGIGIIDLELVLLSERLDLCYIL